MSLDISNISSTGVDRASSPSPSSQPPSREFSSNKTGGLNKRKPYKKKPFFARKRGFKNAEDFIQKLDYKNVEFLIGFVSDKGKILPRRSTNLTSAQQRQLAKTIKRSRSAGLLPFKVKEPIQLTNTSLPR